LDAIMDVAAWLRSLGLERYEAAFRDNEIDGTVLPSLTAEDLKDLGVGLVGHRRKLLDAIAALGADVSGKRPPPDVVPVTDRTAKDAAERRQVTVMFSDLVGSTALAAGMDPEDLREIISAYQKCVAETVQRYDGFVARYMGDGVLVHFGYPRAHEDDAERAVRAGLDLVIAVAALKSPAPLQTRIGIATGIVVVGELIGSGDAQERAIVGKTPNLAARLQGIAKANMVVICDSTRRLLGNLFELDDLGPTDLKGITDPTRAWAALRASSAEGRFEAMHASGLTALVGREEESELLLRRWSKTKTGEGQVVLLSGEAGIGKSRLTAGLLESLATEPHTRIRYFCSPHHAHSPLHPFIAHLERAARFEPGSSASAKLDKLEALLKPTARNAPRDVALIADLLSVPLDGRYPALAVSPQQKREMTLTALLDQLDGIAAQSPVLVVFEDVHWIDPTSLELLDRTIARVADLPVLLVITLRPELQPTWVGQPHVTLLPLSRLGRRDSAGIIGGITKDKALPDAVVEQVLAHTDGVPLFIEELTSTLLESGLLRETTDRYVLDGPLPPLAIPSTLQASLVARLDRLASPKDVAQIGAAIGREFSHELIAAVSDLAPMDLDPALERLTASGLISRRGIPPDATYSFKHALVQDAAYTTLLKSRRRQLHARIANALVERFPAMAESMPEVVAHHFTEAGLTSEAISYWRRAGRLAYARWANREAVKSFEQALHLLETLPETRERQEQAIDLRFDLRNALFPLGEFERDAGYLREAEGLARTLGDQRRLGQLSVYLCHNLWVTGHPREALKFGQSAQAIAEPLGDVPLQVTGNLYLGAACLDSGDYRRAEGLLLKVLQLLEGDLSRERLGLAGFPAVIARDNLTRVFAYQGRFNEGIIHGQEGLRVAEALDHPYSLANTCWHLAHLQIIRGEFSHAADLIDRALALSRQWHLTFFTVAHMGILGYAHALSGRSAEAIPALEHALSTIETMGYGSQRPRFLGYLGEAYVLAGRLDDALEFAGRALTLSREHGQRGYEAWALRILGEVSACRDPPEPGDGHYSGALALAEELGMRPLVAHCHFGLGKLYRRTGKREEAREHLTTAMKMYRAMDMRFWLEEAEAKMRQLQ
jgi:class 3 adenylate cyclase/tetratricopeptide (TPR) repeat protein